ncbi:glycosyltransferase family 4 protein [Bacillus sp. 37MA]|uniref:glycosyltransferase family 4 protein n=1 Tax=Bacillus sp. 37MA TaxID=1132442 RepID=UPI0003A364E1|nr:glycosyltransferase family 4 protein [Bacillus sp. 37MA]
MQKKRVMFYQPYIANWRADFLERLMDHYNNVYEFQIVSGGFKNKKIKKIGNYSQIKFTYKNLISPSFVLTIRNQVYPIYFSPTLLIELFREKPDVIITEGEINILNNIQIYIYSKIRNKNYIWWSLGKVRGRKKVFLNKIGDSINDFLIKNSKVVLARNNYAKNYYLEKGIASKTKIIVAPNSINDFKVNKEIEQYLEIKDEKTPTLKDFYNADYILLFVGALEKTKRLEDLIEVVSMFKKDNELQNVKAVIVGKGDEENNIAQLIKDKKLESDVFLAGAVYDGISKYFIESDLVILPGMGGLVIQHAALHSKPIITRMADGTELDLIHEEKNGYVLQNYDNNELAEKVKLILTNKELMEEMGQYSLKLVEETWNMELMIKRVVEAIEK